METKMEISNGVNKKISTPFAITIVAIVATFVGAMTLIGCKYAIYETGTFPPAHRKVLNNNINNNIVGGDRDEHDCIPSAGYQWCEEKQKCLRNWEEECASLSQNMNEQKCKAQSGKWMMISVSQRPDGSGGGGSLWCECNDGRKIFMGQDENCKKINQMEVSISTDKNSYKQGEDIKITVSNGLNKIIYYKSLWNLQEFSNEKWDYARSEKGYGFDPRDFRAGQKIGDECFNGLYELGYPEKFAKKTVNTLIFHQLICPYGQGLKSRTEYVRKGRYKVSFSYGLSLSKADPFVYENESTVYSNEFIIE